VHAAADRIAGLVAPLDATAARATFELNSHVDLLEGFGFVFDQISVCNVTVLFSAHSEQNRANGMLSMHDPDIHNDEVMSPQSPCPSNTGDLQCLHGIEAWCSISSPRICKAHVLPSMTMGRKSPVS
jgi:hypothetical protein